MKWARKKSSSLINRVFPVSWFSKFKRNSPKNTKNSALDFSPPNSSFYRDGRFYSMDEDDAYWRISFGGDDRIQSTGGINPLWQDSEKDHIFSDFKRFGLAEAELQDRDECRNFSEMVSDIKKMKESRGKQTVRDGRETKANGRGEREVSVSPIESNWKLTLSNSRKPAKNPKSGPDRDDRTPDQKLRVIKMRTEPKTEARVRNVKENSRVVRAYSPRTECKIRALEEMKKARARARAKKKAIKERVVAESTVFDSFAVVKSSRDPHRDFKDSMVEMIRAKGIGHPDDLEELLACYLTLNCDEYHDLIISVFRQVWVELKGAYIDPFMKNASYFDC